LLVLSSSLAVIPKASAATNIVLNESTCTGSMLHGTWSSSPPTCTLSIGAATWSPGYVLIVPFGTKLAVSNSADGSIGLINYGTLTNYGSVVITNTGVFSTGLVNSGTLTNYGRISISNSGFQSTGLGNADTLTNYGTISISNSGLFTVSNGLNNFYGGTLTNHGKVIISNSFGVGLNNPFGIITNDGIITISNGADAVGLLNPDGTILDYGTITNVGSFENTVEGTLTISNSKPFSVGFDNEKGGSVINDVSTISISNTGLLSIGWLNSYGSTLTNDGSMSVTNCPQTYSTGFVAYPGTVVGTYPSPTC
jgi:hypothetical protein